MCPIRICFRKASAPRTRTNITTTGIPTCRRPTSRISDRYCPEHLACQREAVALAANVFCGVPERRSENPVLLNATLSEVSRFGRELTERPEVRKQKNRKHSALSCTTPTLHHV